MDTQLLSVCKSWNELVHREAFSRSRLITTIEKFNTELLRQFPVPHYVNAVQFCFSEQPGSIRVLRSNFLRKIHILAQTVKNSKQEQTEAASSTIPQGAHVFVLDDTSTAHVLADAQQNKKATLHSISKLKIKTRVHDPKKLRQVLKACDMVILGAAAVTHDKVVDVAGAELVAHTAHALHVPVYVVASVLSIDTQNKFLRSLQEGTDYELVEPSLITGIISEAGVYDHHTFLEYAQAVLRP